MSNPAAKGGGIVYETIREALILTTGYVASDSIIIKNADQLQLWVAFTKGSSNGVRLKIEYSDDDSTFFQESRYSLVGTEFQHVAVIRTIIASANLVISLPVAAKYVKVSAQAISSGTSTLLAIKAAKANL